jgi:tRNA A-37 threonylcarbamoyl transferase component Bud32/tetratricopeptide (TPR) repeat protein
MIGKTVGKYQITTELGRGGMGVVYEGRDLKLGRSVALKFLDERTIHDRTAVERFFREARAASALNHPNIVTVFDIGEGEFGWFIAMELIQGRTLRSFTGEGLSIERIADVGVQVAKALSIAHAAGIVHRDIKPENIMVREDGYVKVLDFGLAHLAPESVDGLERETELATRPGSLLGTLGYMSPEQGRGETITAATDVFSLGIVLYELATGRHPFQADSQVGMLHGILSQSPIPPARAKLGIPSTLDALVMKMLEKNPQRRPTSIEVAVALSDSALKSATARPQAGLIAARRRVVGRSQQLAELGNSFEAAAAGRGLTICIAGEPGIGKTTLVEDFFSDLDAQDRACSIARGRCSERLAGTEAYLPVLEALESLLDGPLAESVANAMKLMAPTWYVQVVPHSREDPSLARVVDEAKGASQERLKREMVALLLEISRIRPLIFFCDDLHWADLSTVDLLSYIGSRVGSMRLLLVCTYRPSELLLGRHPFQRVKLELQSHGLCREIVLGFLSREDIERYLSLEFQGHGLPSSFPQLILSKTEGNPLFMADMVRYLRDRGIIAEREGRWTLAQSIPDLERDLPESVRSMIQRKVDQLSDVDRRMLVVASVRGHEFDSAVVAKTVGIEPADVEDRLEALDRIHGFVHLSGEREFPDSTFALRYCFVHILYQNALYGSLTATRRASLSAAVAQTLLGFCAGQNSETAAELALLFEAGRDFARASDCFIAAATNAAIVCANQECSGMLRRAIENAEKLTGDARSSRVHVAAVQLARLYETLAQWSEAVEAYALAEQAAEQLNDAPSQIQAICGKANALFLGKNMEACREQCQRAFELARAQPSEEALASVEMVLYNERLCAGDFEAALDCYDRAVPVLREKGLSPASLLGLNFRGSLHTWRLEHRQAEHVLDWALEKARDVGDRLRILQNHFIRGMSLGHEGRLGEALLKLTEARRLAELNGERFVLARLPNTLGWLHRELLDLEGALKLDLEGAGLAHDINDNEAEISSRINAGQVYLLLGEPQRALDHLQQAENLLERFNWFTWVFQVRLKAELASYWIARGDLQRAHLEASASLEISNRALLRKHIAWGRKLIGDIAAMQERMDSARQEYDAGLRILEAYPCPTVEWRIRKARADLARRMGENSLADEHFACSRIILESLAASVPDDRLRRTLLHSAF